MTELRTEPASAPLRVRVLPRPARVAAAPPLSTATDEEVGLLALAAAASEHWQPLTKRQRAVLRRAAYAVTATMPAVVPTEGLVVELPSLPAGTHPLTVRALERRQLAAGGRISLLGLQVAQHGDLDARPVHDVHAVGGRL